VDCRSRLFCKDSCAQNLPDWQFFDTPEENRHALRQFLLKTPRWNVKGNDLKIRRWILGVPDAPSKKVKNLVALEGSSG
jgi:hypothetical protein